MLPLRMPVSERAGSMGTPPDWFIQKTVDFELETRMRESSGSVRPLVTRSRSPI